MRAPQEYFFTTQGGTRLFYRHWPPMGTPTGALLLFHRGHEHSGRLQHLVDELDLPGMAMFAWDARGHGRSEAGSGANHATIRALVKDVDEFVHHISGAFGIPMEQIAILGQSVGAVLVLLGCMTMPHLFAVWFSPRLLSA